MLIQNMFTGTDLNNIAPYGSESADKRFSEILARRSSSEDDSPSNQNAVQGHDALEMAQKALMATGIPLEQWMADEEALTAFGRFLTRAGFDANDVQSLIDDLKSNAQGNKGVSLANLFNKASQLDSPDETGADALYLDISALPYFETILSRLGMASGDIQTALDRAKVEGRGIDLKALANSLKSQLNPGETNLSPTVSTDNQAMLQRIGLNTNALLGALPGDLAAGDITLDRFAAMLEQRVAAFQKLQSLHSGSPSGQNTTDLLAFMKHVSTSDGETPADMLLKRFESSGLRMALGDRGIARPQLSVNGKTPGAKVNQSNSPATPFGTNLSEIGKNSIGDANVNQDLPHGFSRDNLLGRGLEKGLAPGKIKIEKPDNPAGLTFDGTIKDVKWSTVNTAASDASTGRTLPGYMLNQVSRYLFRMRMSGQSELSFQIKPPHLGRMGLRIEQGGDGIRVSIIVEQAAAKDMLLSQSNDLKTALADQGLRLDKVDVETHADFDRSMAQTRREFSENGGRKRPDLLSAAKRSGALADVAQIPSRMAMVDGLLNLVV
ncbi:MAG: flagellar hook-length control protein FliK [Deltaproteobacteria bacterium]|nr:flagellar hook-length control protein FliK [Deltaproteobacteria bacterium]